MMYFKFRCLDKNSISGLMNRSMWFSNVSEFNDPFEMLPINRVNELSREKRELQEFIISEHEKIEPDKKKYISYLSGMLGKNNEETIGKDNGILTDINYIMDVIENMKYSVLSLSSEVKKDSQHIATNKLMWSHYANGLRGFCLGIDVANLKRYGFSKRLMENQFRTIELSIDVNYQSDYANESPISSISEYLFEKPNLDLHKLFSIKSDDWSYERELRYISPFSGLHQYAPLSETALIIGERMSPQDRNMLIKISDNNLPNAAIYIAKQSNKCFDISLELIQRAPNFVDD